MTATAVRADDPDTLRGLFALRYRVYVERQGYRPPGADHARRVLTDPLDAVSVSFALVDGGEVVGSLRVTALDRLPDPADAIRTYSLGPAVAAFGAAGICLTSRFMVDAAPGRYPRGLFRLMGAAYDWARAGGRWLAYGDCGGELVGFYRHMGYRTYAGPFRDPVYGEKVPLVLVLGDRAWLRGCGSPLARCAARYPDDPAARDWFARSYPDRPTPDPEGSVPREGEEPCPLPPAT